MKLIKRQLIACFKLLLILGFVIGIQSTLNATQLDESTSANIADIYQKAHGLLITLAEEPVEFFFAALLGIVVIVLPAIKILSLILIRKRKSDNQIEHDADPPLMLFRNKKKFDADSPLALLENQKKNNAARSLQSFAKSEYNKTKEIRDAEIALYDLWYDKYFWGDSSDIKTIGNKNGGIKLSPIEKIFYMNFMKHEIQSDRKMGGGQYDFTWLRCQQFINSKTGQKLKSRYLPEKYFIIDFLIEYWFRNPTNKLAVQIAVELDGHEFHEKTKEQAKRDKEKDRVLQAHGYLVARFTGSEVYKDPMEVIDKIDSMANKWILNMREASRRAK